MRIEIKGLSELRQRLAQLRPDEIIARALAEQAQHLAEAVQDRLSEPEGAGSHDTPWVRTGALRDSISATANGLEAAVGSNNPAAAPQEMGTVHIPPRPFLAPAAAAAGERIAHAIGQDVANALRGESTTPTNNGATTASAEATVASGTVQRRTYAVPTTGTETAPAAFGTSLTYAQRRTYQLPVDAPRSLLENVKWTTAVDDYTARSLGMTRQQLGRMIHRLKGGVGLRGDDDLMIHIPTGDVMFNGEMIGNLFDE